MLTSWIVLGWVAQPTVEVPVQVAPLGRLLPELSKRLDKKLIADASVRNDVMAVVSPARPLQEILDGIAAAANATWDERKEGLVLIRSQRRALDDEAEETSFRARLIREAIALIPTDKPFDKNTAIALAAYRKEFKAGDESSSRFRELGPMNARSPVGRFSRRLIEAMGTETFAALPVGQRNVFSDKPNRMQRPLAIKGIGALLDQFRAEQARYLVEVEKQGEVKEGHQYASGFDFVQNVPTTYSKIILSVDGRYELNPIIYLHFLDAQGVALASLRCYLNLNYQPKLTTSQNSPRVELSALSQLRRKVYGSKATLAERTPFHDLVARDPLSFVHTEAMQAWSRHSNKPIFALLPDKGVSGHTSPLSLDVYKNSLGWHSRISEATGRIIVRPLEPASAKRFRADRKLLTEYIRMCVRDGQESLAAQEKLALASPHPNGMRNDQFLSVALPFRSRHPFDLLYLRLFALATPAQQSALKSGTAVRLNALSPEARQAAHQIVFDHTMSDVMVHAGRDYRGGVRDITDQFPDGLPTSTSVQVQITTTDGVSIRTSGTERFVAPHALATLMRQPAAQRPKELRYGVQRKLEVGLNVVADQAKSFFERDLTRQGRWVKYDDLPEALRARVQQSEQ